MLLASVIIPVLNRPKDIALCLESLFKLDFPREDYEIIVVDNGSTDNTKEVIQQFPVRYLFEPKRGRGAARNRGARESQGKYLAFIDSDCIATPNWLTELVKAMEDNPHMAALGGEVVPQKTDRLIERYFVVRCKLQQDLALSSAEKGEGLPRFITANAVVRKEAIEKVGFFDSDFLTHEDTDLSWRLILNGFQVGYVSEAVVVHKHITSFMKFILHQFEFGRASYVINKKYDGILFLYKPLNIKFIFRRFLRILIAPLLFFSIRKSYKEYRNSFALLAVVNSFVVNMGEMAAFILDLIHFTQPIQPPINLDLDKALHKSLRIDLNGFLLRIAQNTVWFISNDLVVFLNIANRYFYKLNETSTRIWQALCDTKDFIKAVKIVSAEYQIPEEIVVKDTRELLEQLEKEKLILKDAK